MSLKPAAMWVGLVVRGWLQRSVRAGRIVAYSALLVACTQVIHNEPINQPLVGGARQIGAELGRDVETYYDDTVIALSFSGGGSRAAAFSYGVLTGFDETPVPNRSSSLLDHVDFVTGGSGGSVLAAYYGLKKRKALTDFKQRFLLRNAEEGLQTELSLMTIARGLHPRGLPHSLVSSPFTRNQPRLGATLG